MWSGAGRGRGWLNLDKNIPKPGELHTSLDSLKLDGNETQKQQYTKLIQLIEQLDSKDDGILTNHKFKVILKHWKSDCNTTAEVEASFKHVYEQCRKNISLAKKLVLMVSSYSFINAKVRDVKVRNLFVNEIQNDFDNRVQMQTSNLNEFHNSISMLTEFYNKARLSDGRPLTLLAIPTLYYFNMLLDSGRPTDLELFTSQLYLNGANLREECSDKVEELLLHVRQLLSKSDTLTPISRIWLLLALDVASNRFSLLPSNLHNFYHKELGDIAMTNFQGTHIVLSIETNDVVTTGGQDSPNPSNVSPQEEPLPSSNSANGVDNLPQSNANFVKHDNFESVNATNNREKIGRPILGIGARLLNYKNPDSYTDGNEQWGAVVQNNGGNEDRNRQCRRPTMPLFAGKSDNKQPNSARDGEQSNAYRSFMKDNKGWEHDDRFDTDYD